MRALLIEDDEMLARGIAAALSQGGYAVEVAGSAGEGLRRARVDDVHIAILDLGLPDRDGLSLLKDMRAEGLAFPVLILTARDRLEDRIRGLDTGADDYLVKPFALGELEARMRALLRRRDEPAGMRQIGRLRFDAIARQASLGESPVDLTLREAAVLEALLARAPRIVSKQALFDAIYPADTEAAPNALEVHVSRLRHKLRGCGVAIRSIRGLGYRIEEGDGDDA